jgi:glutamate N-acetyltransferase/amino-acid N-acetyltransferase
MPVNLPIPVREALHPVKGVRLAATHAGIRKANRYDMLLVALAPGSTVGGVFTQNAFSAAPVQVCRQHLSQSKGIQAWLVNTGCANAGTGQQGLTNALASCELVGDRLALAASQVLPFSTGVILEHLPMDRLTKGIETLAQQLGQADWLDAAQAIMTTDTQPKAASRQLVLRGQTVTITGISKGAGMIRPNMATMLGFVATDAGIDAALLQMLTAQIADQTFNAVTIDGDTSTNDSFVTAATGQVDCRFELSDQTSADWQQFSKAFLAVCMELAQAIVRDGEGATKFITIDVEGATSRAEARQVGYAIAHSPLVKTAFFASDPNLGRILAAIGYSGVPGLLVDPIRVWLDDVLVAEQGGRAQSYQEAAGAAVMAKSEMTIRVDLARGSAAATVYTCDLSHDYVSINADYRS